MELDDLKSAWQALDRRLERQSALSLHLFRTDRLERTRSSLRPLVYGQLLQILFGVAIVGYAAPFWIAHRDVAHLLLAGLVLHAYGVAAIILAGIAIVRICHIDYAAPVVGIQTQLGRLRRLYIVNGLCAGLPWWLLWVLVLVVLAMDAGGADLFVTAPAFVYGSLGAGLAGLLATAAVYRWAADPVRPRLARAVDDSITGSSLSKAQRVLDEIARFEQS